jgi:hypothetical protein
MEILKKEGEEYKKLPVDFAADTCCKMLFEEEEYRKAMAKYNVPKSCPVKEVSIITHNPVFSLN